MAGILVRIDVDDKGNRHIALLGANAKKAAKRVAPLKDILMKTFATIGIYRGISRINEGFKQGIRHAVEYELALKKIAAITNKTDTEMSTLSTTARDLALNTEHSARGIADAMLEITKMGFEPQQTIAALPQILDLATASTEDLGFVAKNSINVMKAFNMDASEMGRVANVVATALNKTSLNFEDYMHAMKFVAPVASSLNMSLEESTAILGVLADMSIRGSLGGTQLKNMLLNLLDVTPATAKAIGDMNVESSSLTSILEQLNTAGVSVADILAQFNKRAVSGALAIGENADKVRILTEALQNQERTAAEVAEQMRTALLLQWKNMVNILDDVAISLNTAFGDETSTFIERLANLFRDLNNWVKQNQQSIRTISKVIFNTLAAGLENAADAAKILLPIWTTLWVTKNVTNIQSAVTSLARLPAILSGAAVAAGPLSLALTAVAAVISTMGVLADRFSDAIDKQMSNVSKFYNTSKHKKFIDDIQAAIDEYHKYKNTLTMGASKWKAVKDAYGDYVDFFGKGVEIEEKLHKNNTAAFGEELQKREDLLARYLETQKKKDDDGALHFDPAVIKASGGSDYDSDGKTSLDEIDAMMERSKFLLQYEGERLDEWQKLYDTAMDNTIDQLLDWGEEYIDVSQEIADLKLEIEEDRIQKEQELQERSKESIINSAESLVDSLSSIMSTYNDAQVAEAAKRYDKEMNKAEARYNYETALAGDSNFRKAMAEEQFTNKKIELQRKQEEARNASLRRQRLIDIAKATANVILASVGVLRDSAGGVITRTAAAISMLAIGGAYIAQLASINYRAGSGGPIHGNGNSTSDNIPALLSPGERALSVNEMNAMGGNEAIQQMIDRGTNYNNNSKVSININNVIGEDVWVRDSLIPTLRTELNR